MAYTYEELSKKRVTDLRELAKELPDAEALHGYSTMHKADLVKALCAALEIEAHGHHEVVGFDKRAIREKIRVLKTRRNEALQARDPVALKRARRQIHRLKHRLRSATV